MSEKPKKSKETREERRARVRERQKDLSYDEIKRMMESKSESIVELDNLPKQTHIWIDRGAKMTCEKAGHPYHEAWKRR